MQKNKEKQGVFRCSSFGVQGNAVCAKRIIIFSGLIGKLRTRVQLPISFAAQMGYHIKISCLAWEVVALQNEIFTLGPFTISWYGLLIAAGFVLAALLGVQRAKRRGLSADAVISIALVGMVAGIVGAKLLYYITELESIIANPSILLDFGNGFVVYGGVLAGVLAGYLYCRRKKHVFLQYFDLLMPSVALAQGVGRIGCIFAQCCYGRTTDAWFGVNNVNIPGVKVVPTQLFSSIGDLAIMGILLLLSRKQRFDGEIGFGYLILYGIGRFVIEFYRADPRGAVGALSTSQFISIFVFAAGALGLLLCYRKSRQELGSK